jgi:hypothetical protein
MSLLDFIKAKLEAFDIEINRLRDMYDQSENNPSYQVFVAIKITETINERKKYEVALAYFESRGNK